MIESALGLSLSIKGGSAPDDILVNFGQLSTILYKQDNCALSLVSLLWDIGKQNSPRCDAAERGVPSGAILFA